MIKHIITRGIGTSPGGPKYMLTAGFAIGAAPTEIPSPEPLSVAGLQSVTLGSSSLTIGGGF